MNPMNPTNDPIMEVKNEKELGEFLANEKYQREIHRLTTSASSQDKVNLAHQYGV